VEARIAVLASGVGTNLQALLDDATVGPRVVLTVSDRADAGALDRAREHGVEAVFLDPSAVSDPIAYDGAMLDLLRERDISHLALAGFMRVLGPRLVAGYAGNIVNVHPALLPAFPGAHAVADALSWGAKVTGVTVHLVDEEIDHGPIVAQEALPVLPGDDWDTLEARVHQVEHRLFPAAVRALVEGRVKVDGRQVAVVDEPS
jgi:phosphoribosylglycinamide formyltransferase 1